MKGRSANDTRSRRNGRVTLAIVLGTSFLLLVGAALATPGVGILSAPVHARGTLGEDQVVNSKSGVHLKTKAPSTLQRNRSSSREGARPAGTATRARCW
jgi:hypothetical protein